MNETSRRTALSAFRRTAARALQALLPVMLTLTPPAPGARAADSDRGTTFSFTDFLDWQALPPLPDPHGVAGPFAGVCSGHLIVAGGANFPEKKPWEGGAKQWHDTVYALQEGSTSWTVAGRLPRPLAYGVSITTKEGLLCIGGDDARQAWNQVFLLQWDGSRLSFTDLPPLPVPLSCAAGAALGDVVYVAGGLEAPGATQASGRFFALDLEKTEEGWKELETWPGPGRILPVAGTLGKSFYLLSGASLAPGPDGKAVRTYLTDAYRYTPGEGWERIADLPRPAVAAPSPALTLRPGNLVVLGGDDGRLAGRPSSPDHPGFPRTVLNYHEVTGRWAELPGLPEARVTVPVVAWGNAHVIPSGEVRPGIRTPAVASVHVRPGKAGFGALNYASLSLYLILILGVGVWCARGQKNTQEFFRGGQRIPWWAAGLSIYATMLSSITFMSVPAKAYAEDWVFALANLPILMLAPFVVWVVLPVFRRIDATSAYEYLEKRFSLPVRLFGAASFVLFQIGRMAVVLYLPALALSAVTDFNIHTCIALMGVLGIIYCSIGGISAVIWTDVVQSVVLLGGALLSLILILAQTQGGVAGFFEAASAQDKFRMVNWTWDYTTAALWVIIVGNLFSNLIPYTSDQAVVQRYMTTSDEKGAARSVWLNGILAIPSTVLFFLVGTALYVFYTQKPDRLLPGSGMDAVFPLFIAWELPAGVAGVVVAGIFAAAQSTVSTSMNSVATVLVTDFIRRLRRRPLSEAAGMFYARSLTALSGVLGCAGAFLLATMDLRSLWDAFLKILGLTGGALAGLFMLGIFSRRTNATGALAGAFTSIVVLYGVQQHSSMHFFLYAPVGIGTCFGVGWLASLLSPAPDQKVIRTLTIAALRAPGPEAPARPEPAKV